MEVIVCVVVLGTGIVLLAQGLSGALRGAARVQRTVRAAQVADEVFARMETGEIDFLAETEGTLAEMGYAAGESGAGEEEEAYRTVFAWNAGVQTWGFDDLYRVTLRITWEGLGSEESRTFEADRLFYRAPEEEE
jgi:type II secretory pathway pseudopilin PulG